MTDPLEVKYQEEVLLVHWFHDKELNIKGYLLRCPKCGRTGLIDSDRHDFKVDPLRRLTAEGNLRCPRGCKWVGSLVDGVLSDA